MADGKIDFYSQFSDEIDPKFLRVIVDQILRDPRLEDSLDDGNFCVTDKNKNIIAKIKVEDFIVFNVVSINWYFTGYHRIDWTSVYGIADSSYRQKIVERFFQQIPILGLLNIPSLFTYRSYCPITLTMECLVNALLDCYATFASRQNKKGSFNDVSLFEYNSLLQCTQNIMSIIEILKFGDLQSASASLRSLIERYFIYLAAQGDSKAINEYNRLLEIKRHYRFYGKYSKDFEDEIKKKEDEKSKEKNKKITINPGKYVNYNWVNKLKFFGKQKLYTSMEDVVGYIKNYIQIPSYLNVDELDKVYKDCSLFVHGGLAYFDNDWDGYYSIIKYTSTILLSITVEAEKMLHKKCFKYNCINLREYLNTLRSEMIKIGDPDWNILS